MRTTTYITWETIATRKKYKASVFDEIYENFKSSLENFYKTVVIENRQGYHSLLCSLGECIDGNTQLFSAIIDISDDSITIRLIADNWRVLEPVTEYSKNILQRVR